MPIKLDVVVLPEAKEDMVDLYVYVARHDSIFKADQLLENLERRIHSLADCSLRGHAVPELQLVHVEGFREIHFKPYRIIYQCSGGRVYIHAVIDGRRDLQEFLERRMLG